MCDSVAGAFAQASSAIEAVSKERMELSNRRRQVVHLEIQETIYHPGHDRVALAERKATDWKSCDVGTTTGVQDLCLKTLRPHRTGQEFTG